MWNDMTPDEKRRVDQVRKLPWVAVFLQSFQSPIDPADTVDMYSLLDGDTGVSIANLGVISGEDGAALAHYIAACCADPYFVRLKNVMDTKLAVAFNEAVLKFAGDGRGEIDGQEVAVAAMTMFCSYVEDLPDRSRFKLVDSFMKKLVQLRRPKD